MPRGDQTGPDGQGPMTGRGMGYCNGYDRPGSANSGFGGRGSGFGMGRGRGFGRATAYNPRGMIRPRFQGSAQPIQSQQPYPQQPTKEQELDMLEQEEKLIHQEQEDIKKELEDIKKRISELKTKK